MKFAIATIASAIAMAGCVSSAGTYVDTMKGIGSAKMMPDGTKGFTFVISENAYDGIISRSDTKTLRAQHDYIIGAWVGNSGACNRGYSVTGPQRSSGVFIYEGRCK